MSLMRVLGMVLLGATLVGPVGAAPKITGFAPRSGAPGTTVTLTGSGLGSVNSVNFSGAQATIVFANSTVLQAIVPPNAVNGPIYIRDTQGFTYDTGSANLVDFLTTPRITSVKRVNPPADTPAEEVRIAPGNILEISGANYLSFTDPAFAPAVRVDFSGTSGNVRVVPTTVGTTLLQVVAPNTGVSGPVTVLTPIGQVTFPGDVYYQPLVSRFTPAATNGATLEIVGVSLKGASQVLFGAVAVAPTSVTPTNILVRVPPVTGPVRLTVVTPGGAYLTSTNFNLAPTVETFSPAGGPAGTTVVLAGTGLGGSSRVRFGNLDAAVVSATPTSLTTIVPVAAATGPITVITPWGTNTSATPFYLPPRLATATPSRGKAGTVVTLSGSGLVGATEVRFAGTPAAFAVGSATTITATVPEGAVSGPVVVVNPGGTSTPGVPFTVVSRAPLVDALAPESGPPGTVVALSGLNLLGTTGVEFSNAPASTFTVLSDTHLTVTVPAGARTGPVVVRNGFGSGQSPRSFVVGTNASLSLVAGASPLSLLAGETAVLSLEARNGGPLAAAGSTVTVLLPDGLDYVDSTLTAGLVTLLLEGVSWNIGTLQPGQSALGSLRLRPRFVDSFPVTATAATTTPDLVTTDDQQSVTIFAVRPQLSLRGREGTGLVLGWSVNAVDYVLQSAPVLAPEAWSRVPDAPVQVQDELRVVVPAAGAARWYRLAPR